MKRTTISLKIMAILPLAFALIACNPIENETTSASMLIVNTIVGESLDGDVGNYLESDVLYEDEDKGITTIYADPAIATLTASLLDQDSITGPSHLNSITVERYRVSYSRSDGRATEGVDVPYAHEGMVTVLLNVGTTSDVTFTIVRAAAKAEPPLVDLSEGRDNGILTCLAKVEFFGKDQVGRAVKATGYLTIHFANYVNESGGGGGEAAGRKIQ
jgi:hypothetical protein